MKQVFISVLFFHYTHFSCLNCLCQISPPLPPLWNPTLWHFLYNTHPFPRPPPPTTPHLPSVSVSFSLSSLSNTPSVIFPSLCILFATDVWFLIQHTYQLSYPNIYSSIQFSWILMMPPLCLFSKTKSSSSSTLPSLNSSSINSWSSTSSVSSCTTSWFLSMISCTHDIPKINMDFEDRKPTANQFSARHSYPLSSSQKMQIIKGHFPGISRRIIRILTWIAIYFHHGPICCHVFCVKGCYKNPIDYK